MKPKNSITFKDMKVNSVYQLHQDEHDEFWSDMIFIYKELLNKTYQIMIIKGNKNNYQLVQGEMYSIGNRSMLAYDASLVELNKEEYWEYYL